LALNGGGPTAEVNAAKDLERTAKIQAWVDRTWATDAAGELVDRPDPWRDNLVGLADPIGPTLDANHAPSSAPTARGRDRGTVQAPFRQCRRHPT